MDDATTSARLKKVIAILEEAHVPDDLREEAFRSVWGALAGDHVAPTISVQGAGPPRQSAATGGAWTSLSEGTGIDPETLEEIYSLEPDATFAVRVPTSSLPKAKASATRDIAILVCAGRQASVEEWTPGDVIREVCQHYDKYDAANNAQNLSLGDGFWQVDGKGKARRYKLRKTGWEEAGNIMRRIVEG